MPTYLYKCEQCGEFEVFQKITEDSLKECPTCKQPVQRMLQAGYKIRMDDYKNRPTGKRYT